MKIRMLRAVLLTSVLFAASRAPADETTVVGLDFDPVRVGTKRAELQERFGEALRTVDVVVPRTLMEQIVESKALEGGDTSSEDPVEDRERDAFAGQERLGRSVASADIRSAEYDLFEGRVYRTRWRFDERFERPLMSFLVDHLREALGEPSYDQTIEAKVGSPKSDLRRSGWRSGNRVFEVRQLHPFSGGPLFASLSDIEAMDRIVSSQGVALPQPETTVAWWSRPQREMSLATAEQRDQLVRSIDALLTKIEFERD